KDDVVEVFLRVRLTELGDDERSPTRASCSRAIQRVKPSWNQKDSAS
ncbi:MAG: hypothetical protein JWO86_1865, partial [Myxococcaceae bacterium]|nr:hypothetical protein [Myxococcaceae bacterium]